VSKKYFGPDGNELVMKEDEASDWYHKMQTLERTQLGGKE